jgi:hypothetical protein
MLLSPENSSPYVIISSIPCRAEKKSSLAGQTAIPAQ